MAKVCTVETKVKLCGLYVREPFDYIFDEEDYNLFLRTFDLPESLMVYRKYLFIYGAFISVHVPAGEHNITLKYTPVNLILGCIITSLCIIILIGIYFFKRMCRMNVISTDSWPVLIQELICEDDVILMDRRKTETQSIYDDDINPHDSPMPLDDFSLDELDDFDNLDSDESNHAD